MRSNKVCLIFLNVKQTAIILQPDLLRTVFIISVSKGTKFMQPIASSICVGRASCSQNFDTVWFMFCSSFRLICYRYLFYHIFLILRTVNSSMFVTSCVILTLVVLFSVASKIKQRILTKNCLYILQYKNTFSSLFSCTYICFSLSDFITPLFTAPDFFSLPFTYCGRDYNFDFFSITTTVI